jgi:hypothetical protein
MTDSAAPASATERLAALVAQRRAKNAAPAGRGPGWESEKSAAARQASKSKPALRK